MAKQTLADIAQIYQSTVRVLKEGKGDSYQAVYPQQLSNIGYIEGPEKKIMTDTPKERVTQLFLEPYDILVVTKGVTGKVGIVGENIGKKIIPSMAMAVIKIISGKPADRIAFYCFLLSKKGQKLLEDITPKGRALPAITTRDLKNMPVPALTDDKKKEMLKEFKNYVRIKEKLDASFEKLTG